MKRNITIKLHGALVVSIIFLLIAIGPATATYIFPLARSDAMVDSDTSGDITSGYPVDLPYDINQPENVVVRYNGTWDDQRWPSGQLNLATFYYNVTAEYPPNTFHYDEYEIQTDGMDIGYHILEIIIPNVSISTIPITYNATLSVTTHYFTHNATFYYRFV